MKILKVLGLIIIIAVVAAVTIDKVNPTILDQISYPLEYKEEIEAASDKYDLDPYLVCGIIYVESKFDPSSESPVGAIGMMQIMPQTGEWVAKKRKESYSIEDLDNPSVNIDTGCWYYKYLLTKYKNEKLALAAYNSGFKNVDRWVDENKNKTVDEIVSIIPYKETRQFVERVDNARHEYGRIYKNEFANRNNDVGK